MKWLIAVAALLISFFLMQLTLPVANAQDRLASGKGRAIPNDTELKATYCMVVIDRQRKDLQNALNSLSTQKTQPDSETARVISEAIKDGQLHLKLLNDRISRLSSFLLPRQKHLDAKSLLAAMDRGNIDSVASDQATKQCRSTCTASTHEVQCLTDCMQTDEASKRVRQCADLSFLPY